MPIAEAELVTGFITTCLLQSSSATTVIVVSFVNVGLLTLVVMVGWRPLVPEKLRVIPAPLVAVVDQDACMGCDHLCTSVCIKDAIELHMVEPKKQKQAQPVGG